MLKSEKQLWKLCKNQVHRPYNLAKLLTHWVSFAIFCWKNLMRDIFSVGLVLTWGWNYETSGNVYNVPLYLKKYPTFTTREKHFSSFLTINSTFTLFRISWDFGSIVSLISQLMLICMTSKTMLLVYKPNTMLCTSSKRSHHMLWCSKAILEDVMVLFFLLDFSRIFFTYQLE